MFNRRSAICRVGSSKSGFFAMTDIDPETASLALVGRFLKRVCDLEERLNEAIASILEIDDNKRFILCANIHFREKICILRSFVNNSNLTGSDKEKFNIELTKIGNLYDRRNTLAHQHFRPAQNGDGVIFSIVHAKGGAAPLETPWTKKTFNDDDTELDGMLVTATRLKDALTGGTFAIQGHLWLTQSWYEQGIPLPMRNISSPALWDYQSHQPRSLHDSQERSEHQSNPKTPAQTPDKPQE
jgi:hypothetical protein